jgi:mono/diheme cytochrome c family protein
VSDPNPHQGHGGGGDEPAQDRLASALSNAQFFVTGLVLCVIATLAYIAGSHSAKGGGGEGGGAAPPGAAAGANVDVSTLLKPTPELIAKGKSLFALNCASCHGTSGQGNGPAAAALNPKPRDFTSGYWKYGGGVARVVRTISEGSPGTAMAAFTSIPLEDRFAIAQYERSLSPKPGEDKPEDLAWLGIGQGGASGKPAGGAAMAAAAPSGPTMPIEKAMAMLTVPEPPAGLASTTPAPAPTGPGADVYAQRCVSCHGGGGEGGVRVRMLGSAPYAYVVTRSLGATNGDWTRDYGAFESLIIQGLPGYEMPGNGDLSRGAIHDLYDVTMRLRSGTGTAGHAGS